MFLLEKYDKNHKFLPKTDDSHARAKMWQFFSYGTAELYPFIAKSWEIMYRPGITPESMGKELEELGKARSLTIPVDLTNPRAPFRNGGRNMGRS